MAHTRRRLDAWKEIGAYLKRDVTTVRRWEKREGLPVHRHMHDKLGSVYAYTDEIDDWCERRRARNESANDVTGVRLAGNARRPRSLTAALVAAALIAGMTTDVRLPSAPERAGVTTLAIEPPAGVTIASMALSPDGDRIAFAAYGSDGGRQLWIRPLDAPTPIPFAGTEGAAFPFWAPDGRRVGFFAEGKLKTLELTTREIRTIAEAVDGRGGTWSRAGVILFAPAAGRPLYRVSAAGGPATPVTTVARSEIGGHAWPEFLPDGHRFLYLNTGGWPKAHGIYAGDLRTGSTKRLMPAFSSASFHPGGYILYVADDLVAQRFDADRLEVLDVPVRIAGSVLVRYMLDHKAEFSVSAAGPLVVRQGADGGSRLVRLDRRGRQIDAFDDAAAYSSPTLSPDGTRAIATVYENDSLPGQLWMIDLPTRRRTQLTFGKSMGSAPVWSPASDRIVFASMRGSPQPAFYERVLSGGAERRLPWTPAPESAARAWALQPDSWTRDAKYFTYTVLHTRRKFDVWAIELSGEGRSLPVARSEHNDVQGHVSPDGRWVAFVSDETGQPEVYVQSFPSARARVRISPSGGGDPRWRSDGRELFYVSTDRQLMSVGITPGAGLHHAPPRALFTLRVRALWNDMRNNYDVAADGGEFLAVVPRDDPRSAFLTVMVNWRALFDR